MEIASADVADRDIEAGGESQAAEESSNNMHGTRRKRRVSTMFLLSGGPLAHHSTIPGLKSQDSMTSVERVGHHNRFLSCS